MASYDDLAARFEARVQLFVGAVAGERAMAVAAGSTPASLKRWSRAKQYRDAFAQDALHDLQLYMDEYLAGAEDVFVSRGEIRLQETLAELSNLTAQVLRQNNRDSLRVIDLVKDSGAIGLLAQRKMAQPNAMVEDASGRKWDIGKLVRVITRDFAYQTFIDSEFSKAVQDGANVVILEHPNQDHPMNGVQIDLTAPQEGWMAIRDETFHVNSHLGVNYAHV